MNICKRISQNAGPSSDESGEMFMQLLLVAAAAAAAAESHSEKSSSEYDSEQSNKKVCSHGTMKLLRKVHSW